jgi:hypothetical protein
MTAHHPQRTTNADRVKHTASVKRTIEALEGKEALMLEWENAGGNKAYLQHLRAQTTKLRARLKNKGILFDDSE